DQPGHGRGRGVRRGGRGRPDAGGDQPVPPAGGRRGRRGAPCRHRGFARRL
ncbi:MAG: hypothetical protein AVDCRST_MAG41-4500, partial [uncultured Corynebacteriales bacterium]